MEKWPFFDQNHGLTPLEKSQFFDFLNFFFLQARKAFFRSRISQNTVSWLILPTEKRWKNGHFLTKTMGNPFGKISIFRLLELFFYGLERRFFLLEYWKTHFCVLCWPKKKMEKWPIFHQNHGLTPLEKSQFFCTFLTFCFYCLERFFFVQEYW